MHRRSIALKLILVSSLGIIVFAVYNLNKMPPSPYPDIHLAFSLHNVNGSFSMKDLNGKVGVVYFGYTHCPDVCPATLGNIGAAMKLLSPAEAAKVRVAFITTDPKRDTPAYMAKFLQFFGTGMTGLSGSTKEISAAAKSFMVGYTRGKPTAGKGYTVIHSSSIYILRPDGKIGKLISHNSTPKEIADTIRRWLPWART